MSKCKPITFKNFKIHNAMDNHTVHWRQNCPIGSHLNFLEMDTKNCKKHIFFLHSGKLLEFSVLVHIFGVPPIESSRHEDYENVVVFGCGAFQRGVVSTAYIHPTQRSHTQSHPNPSHLLAPHTM
jgi:hypothetical protein